MSIFDSIFRSRRKPPIPKNGIRMLDYYNSVFTNWNGEIYENALVRASIETRARHMSKLRADFTGEDDLPIKQVLSIRPNKFQTWSQFFARTSTILDVATTCFIAPMYDKRLNVVGIWTLLPQKTEIREYGDEYWIRYELKNGERAAIELEKCGILTKFQYSKEFYGEGNGALEETMGLIHLNNQSIKNAIKNSTHYRFMASLDNFGDAFDIKEERKRFTELNLVDDKDNEGILLFPRQYTNVRQLEEKLWTIDTDQVKTIQDNVNNYFGTNIDIIQNKASYEEADAFFNGAIEPFSIQISEVISGMLFTDKQIRDGNYFYATANRLQYMSISQKVQMAKELGDRGAIMIDEIRAMFNYPPLPNGEGQHAPLRGEYKWVDEKNEEGEDNE